MDNNNNHGDYSAPEPYNPDAQYGFPQPDSQPGGNAPQGGIYGGGSTPQGSPYGDSGYGSMPQGSPYGGSGYGSMPQGSPYENAQSGCGAGQSSYGQNGYGNPQSGAFQNGAGGCGADGYGNNGYGGGNGYSYGSGNYGSGYNPQGPAPMDRKGRVVPNNFGMKLTFAIIEIALELIGCFMGLWCYLTAPLVLSVIACVMVCLQNRDYQQGNWSGFLSKKKTATVLLWVAFGIDIAMFILLIVIVVMLIAGIGFLGDALSDAGYDSFGDFLEQYQNADEEDMEQMIEDLINGEIGGAADDSWDDYDYDDYDYDYDYDDYDYDDYDYDYDEVQSGENLYVEGFEEFELNGVTIALPISVEEFSAAGFWFEDADLESELESMTYDGYAYYGGENGEYIGTVFVYNVRQKDMKMSKGIIGGLTINSYDDVDLKLVNGLSFRSSPDDAVEALGAPTGGAENDGYLNMEWYMYGDYGRSIELDFEDGVMYEVWLMNDAELQEQLYN